MKGLILSGGKGTRLRPLTYTSAKQLVPVANKPVLFYAIEAIVAAGITEIGIIVGDTHDEIRAAVGDGSRFGARVTYIQQDAPRGLAHAVMIAARLPRRRPVRHVPGRQPDRRRHHRAWSRSSARCGCNSEILLAEVPNPEQFGVAELTADGKVRRLVEKPQRAAEQPRAGRRLHVRPRHLRVGAPHQALGARRARDHRRHPGPDRPRARRPPAHRARLVEGHRQARGHAGGQPHRARDARSRRGASGELVGQQPRSRGGCSSAKGSSSSTRWCAGRW